ncbi:MAG: hypothetical protein WC444_07245 [Candidatus Paceibacterota bacterium]
MANWADYFSKGMDTGIDASIKSQQLDAQEKLKMWLEQQDLPLKKAREEYYTAQTKLMNDPNYLSALSGNPIQDSQETKFEPDDYMDIQETRNVKGVPKVVNVRKLKPAVSEKHADVITSSADLISSLEIAKNYISQGAKSGFLEGDVPFNDFLRKKFGSNATIGLAQTLKQLQSKYITSQTGAQRGFKEMNWYEPSMPTLNMPRSKLVPMLEDTAMLQELNLRNMLITAKKRGDRLGEYKDIYNQLISKYPTEIIPYGIGQGKASLLGRNIDKVKQALAEGYTLNDVLKHINKKNAK